MRVISLTRGGRLALFAVVAASASTLSCSGGTDSSDDTRPTEMRLQIAGKQVTVLGTGAVVGETIVLRVGVAAPLSAVFTDDFEVPVGTVVPGDFRLDGDPFDSSLLSYTPGTANTLTGTLTPLRTSPGTTVRFTLYHVPRHHIDWGPYSVTFVIVN